MYTPIGETFGIIDALLVALISIIIVFVVLATIIICSNIFSKAMDVVDKKTNINPRKENSLLNDDEDAVAAALVATIDFYKEYKKDARLVSIRRVEEDE